MSSTVNEDQAVPVVVIPNDRGGYDYFARGEDGILHSIPAPERDPESDLRIDLNATVNHTGWPFFGFPFGPGAYFGGNGYANASAYAAPGYGYPAAPAAVAPNSGYRSHGRYFWLDVDGPSP